MKKLTRHLAIFLVLAILTGNFCMLPSLAAGDGEFDDFLLTDFDGGGILEVDGIAFDNSGNQTVISPNDGEFVLNGPVGWGHLNVQDGGTLPDGYESLVIRVKFSGTNTNNFFIKLGESGGHLSELAGIAPAESPSAFKEYVIPMSKFDEGAEFVDLEHWVAGTVTVDSLWLRRDATEPRYNPGDVAVINNMIDNNGLPWPKAPADGSGVPDEWRLGITWNNDAANRRIVKFVCNYILWGMPYTYAPRNISGHIDLTGLDALEILIFSHFADITGLNVSNNPKLTELHCFGLGLTELDISNNPKLKELAYENGSLTELDVSNNPELTRLNCSNNNLTSLDVSNNPALIALYTINYVDSGYKHNNSFTMLDVSNNPELEVLACANNQLTSLDVSHNPKLWNLNCRYNYLGAKSNIPGIENVDVRNVYFYPQHAEIVWNGSGDAVASLETEYVTGYKLNSLTLDGEEVDSTNYTVSTGSKTVVTLKESYLKTLDETTHLFTADISYHNPLHIKLTVKQAPQPLYNPGDIAVINAMIDNNNMRNQQGDVWQKAPADGSSVPSDWRNVVWSDDDANKRVISLLFYSDYPRVSGNVDLRGLDCLESADFTSKYLDELDVSGCAALTSLKCPYIWNLTSLDVSGCTALTYLDCEDSKLTSLDVSDCISLEYLYCWRNKLTELDVSNSPALKRLRCNENKLTSLDVCNNPALEWLYCEKNQLTSLDLSNNPNLSYLSCAYNYLPPRSTVDLESIETVYYNPQHVVITWNGSGDAVASFEFDTEAELSYFSLNGSQFPNNNYTADKRGKVIKITLKEDWLTAQPDGTYSFRVHFGSYMELSLKLTVKQAAPQPIYNPGDIAVINNMIDNNGLPWPKAPADGSSVPDEWSVWPTVWSNDSTNKRVTTLRLFDIASGGHLDVSGLEALEVLQCSDKKLTSLDVGNNPALTVLRCSGNQFTTLDVSNNPNLTELWCWGNKLTMLDVSQNPLLSSLFCYYNYLDSRGDVPGIENVPDVIFDLQNTFSFTVLSGTGNGNYVPFKAKPIVAEEIEGNPFLYWEIVDGSGTFGDANAASTTFTLNEGRATVKAVYENVPVPIYDPGDIAVINRLIDNNGLSWEKAPADGSSIPAKPNSWEWQWRGATWSDDETYKRVTELRITYDANDPDPYSFSALRGNVDLRGLDMLERLFMYNQYLITGLDVSGCPALSELNCTYDQLAELDVSHNPLLRYLYCYSNKLTELDVSHNPALEYLSCGDNNITELDVSHNPAMKNLGCWGNKLTVLDTSDNPALVDLTCSQNQLTMLNVSQNTKLDWLTCGNNRLTELDVSNCPALRRFECDNNLLTSLNLGSKPALKEFRCYYNQLTELDVSKAPAMTNLLCGSNLLTILNVSNNTSLTNLLCENNQLTALDVSRITNLFQLQCENNQITTLDISRNSRLSYFQCQMNYLDITPGSAFMRQLQGRSFSRLIYSPQKEMTEPRYNPGDVAVINGLIDNNGLDWPKAPADGSSVPYEWNYFSTGVGTGITWSEDTWNKRVDLLNLVGSDIFGDVDLSGLEGLKWLTLRDSQATGLNISNTPALTSLSCYRNKLTELDVSNRPALMGLSCADNLLTELDISNTPALISLNCGNNLLTELDVSGHTALNALDCSSNQLTELDVSNNTGLYQLYCQDNKITELDVSQNVELAYFYCNKNQLTGLDVTNNPQLIYLWCGENRLTGIDVSNCQELYSFYCNDNLLTELDVTKNPRRLTALYCQGNQLTELDISKNRDLSWLNCENNRLTELDITQTYMFVLNCSYNNLSSLNLGNSPRLSELDCRYNYLDITPGSEFMRQLDGRTFTKLDYSPQKERPDEIQTVIMRIDNLYASVNGEKVRVNDAQELTPIFNQGGRTMVPFRFLATAFGAEIDWDEGLGSVIIDHNGKHIQIPIGLPYAIVDGVQTPINAPAQIMTFGRTFVPFRAVSELLDINVDYDFDTMTIIASEGEIDVARCVAEYNALIAG